MITITTPPMFASPLAVPYVASRLGLSEGERAEEIGEAIREVSEEIQRWAPTVGFGMATVSQDLAGEGAQIISLGRRPIDPDSLTVTISGDANTDYKVYDAVEGMVYLWTGWPGRTKYDGDGVAYVNVTYKAGYVMPDGISTWAKSETYAVGEWVRPLTPNTSGLLMECTTAGASGTTEPTWPAAGSTVTDNAAVWTARTAWELPATISRIALLGVQRILNRELPELQAQRAEGYSESYDTSMLGAILSEREQALVASYGRMQ